jgi:quercetin dioxygenase-like cupin family protein
MDDLSSKIHKLADIADYQKDSIVSKVIIEKDAGSVTFFAFDKGQGLSEHTAPFDALVTIIEGKVEIIISGEKYQLGKEEMIIMPANKPHALKAIDKFKMLLILIKS